MNPEQFENQFTGLILAGGQSRRFGSNKALHPINGRPMIHWVYKALQPVCTTILISCQNATLFDLDATFVADNYPNAGPLGGLEAGLRASTTPWTMVLPVDMPFIEPSLLIQLKQACTRKSNAELEAVLVHDKFGIQPLVGCYHQSVYAAVKQQMENEDYAVRSFVKSLKHDVVELPDTELRNFNKLDDLSSST